MNPRAAMLDTLREMERDTRISAGVKHRTADGLVGSADCDLLREFAVDTLQMADALSAAITRLEWCDITKAPKDGTWLLVFVPETGRAHVCKWDAEFELEFDAETDDTRYRGAWTDHAVHSFGYEEVKQYQPTHFMPLPPGPTAEAGQ